MERDEVYVPWTRKELGIPQDLQPVGAKGVEDEHVHHQLEWDELFGDTPIWTLFCLIRQQVLAFPAYLRTCHLDSELDESDRCLQSSTSRDRGTIPSGQTTLTVSCSESSFFPFDG